MPTGRPKPPPNPKSPKAQAAANKRPYPQGSKAGTSLNKQGRAYVKGK